MREKRQNSDLLQQQSSNDGQDDLLRQAVEHEYSTLYRKVHKAAQKTARHVLRHVAQPSPPRPLIVPIPVSTVDGDVDVDDDDIDNTVTVLVADGTNKNPQKNFTIPTYMPTLPVVRELISYVPTIKNMATRGHLIGIPYLGDKFDAEDQRLINSISIEPSKQQKLVRSKLLELSLSTQSNNHDLRLEKKLDESSLEILFQSLRSNKLYQTYSNDQIIDEILRYHRDSTPQAKLFAFANQTECSSIVQHRNKANIDEYDSIDVDIDELVIKPWCARFCPRCYTYNCLLHKEGPSYLPLPKQIPIFPNTQSESCSSTCYKCPRQHLKRPLSPTFEQKKRQRKASNPTITNENLTSPSNELSKRHSSQYLTCIENHPLPASIPNQSFSLTDRSLFRLFYFLFDGDLCQIAHFFFHRTCPDLYKQFISDSKYFSEHTLVSSNQSAFSIRQPYRRRMPEGSTRTFLNYMKKNLHRTQSVNKWKNTTTTLKPAYQPCLHDGPCTSENSQCHCISMGTFCEKYCNCSIDCPRRFPGCACKGACLFNNCLCAAEGRECDPDLCHNCGASLLFDQWNPSVKLESTMALDTEEDKVLSSASMRNVRSRTTGNLPVRSQTLRSCRQIEPAYKVTSNQGRRTNSRASLNLTTTQYSPMITCANISLQRKIHKQILVAESDVAGYGAFLGSSIAQPGDLIAEYVGEIISEEEADRRGRLYDKRACSYLFNLDTQHCIDARQFGNKLRFANHSSKANCVPKIKLVNGDYRIGIYAKEVILQGDELFFEYMYDAHQRQQFTNNERIDESEQENLRILARYADNFMLVQSTYD